MRNESEMMDIIMNTAKADDRIRAVEMNGSRANPNAPVDCFQDYDICYYVNDITSFTKDHGWIDIFGERLMLQMPELGRWPANDGGFNYLILFTDGNRIDLLRKTKELHSRLPMLVLYSIHGRGENDIL